MPLEVKELVIRAHISDGLEKSVDAPQKSNDAENISKTQPGDSLMYNALSSRIDQLESSLLDACVAQVFHILDREREK